MFKRDWTTFLNIVKYLILLVKSVRDWDDLCIYLRNQQT